MAKKNQARIVFGKIQKVYLSNETQIPEEDGGKSSLEEIIKDPEASDPADEAEKNILKDNIRSSLSCLNDEEQRLIKLLHGLDDEGTYSLEEAAAEMNISIEQAKIIEKCARGKLHRIKELEDDF